MPIHILNLQLENQTLRSEFAIRDLDLKQALPVFQSGKEPTAEELELENRQLLSLLDWVEKYQACGNRKQMEKDGYRFPPVQPCIDPDSDWLRFELWLKNRPLRSRMAEQLPRKIVLKNPQTMSDAEIEEELQHIYSLIDESNFSIDLNEGVPARLIYQIIREVLHEEFDFIACGYWHIDGCSGYCPGCVQRPWCASGGNLCWQEDEESGCMSVPPETKRYISPSPASLLLLQNSQQEQNNNI